MNIDFIKNVIFQYENHNKDKALDVLYDGVDDELLNGNFDNVNELIDITLELDAPIGILVGFLTITFVFTNKISSKREKLYNFTYQKAAKQNNEDYAKKLLKGLE